MLILGCYIDCLHNMYLMHTLQLICSSNLTIFVSFCYLLFSVNKYFMSLLCTLFRIAFRLANSVPDYFFKFSLNDVNIQPNLEIFLFVWQCWLFLLFRWISQSVFGRTIALRVNVSYGRIIRKKIVMLYRVMDTLQAPVNWVACRVGHIM